MQEQEKSIATPGGSPANKVAANDSWYSFLVPGVVGLVLAKTLGLVGGLVAVGVYFYAKPKLGMVGAGVAAALAGLASGIALVSIMR